MRIGNKGFSLVELLVVMVVSGVIMAGIYSTFKTQQDSYLAQEQVAEMQQNIRAGFYVMASELRLAGYDVDKNGDKTGTAGITAASSSPSTITFTLVADTDGADNNGDGTTDEVGELKIITYNHYDANIPNDQDHFDLGRQVGTSASAKRAIAENIEQLEFYYSLADGTQTIAPTAAQLEDIRSVEISILAITGHSDRKYTNNQSYASASGVDWTPAASVNSRRRFQRMTVKFRNMGL